ncbi:bZIP transcription factor 27-like [Zingiber officinale]|uniref:bZIP transcription factor 27-like n=1 Tax=Zingiber officinale TaxID=94328 RepID=UPI001C4CE1E1|nr:bZIP transcription factor 27-like [Zingiber officinale]
MWSFGQLDRRPNRRGACSSSLRSSPSSTVLPQPPKRRTMEELWKDRSLNVSSSALDQHGLYHHCHPADSSSPPFPNMVLQDFLAGPLNRPPYLKPADAEELPFQPPEAALSLSSGLEFHLLGEPDQAKAQSNSSSNYVASNETNVSFISSALPVGPPSPTALFSFCSRKRSTESPGAADRCQKRMIKNRESAARSRARKQAYTIELELEVSQLKEENAKLLRQNEELKRNQVAVVTKATLQRSSTAPF